MAALEEEEARALDGEEEYGPREEERERVAGERPLPARGRQSASARLLLAHPVLPEHELRREQLADEDA